MKHLVQHIFTLFLLLFSAAICCGQTEITIYLSDVYCDSVRLQSFNWKKKSGTNLTLPFNQKVVFKQNTALAPGVYWITADSIPQASVILSGEKKQKMTIYLKGGEVDVVKNEENLAFQQYKNKMRAFAVQMEALDQAYQEARQLPAYMLRTLADSLTMQARRIQQSRRDYETQLVHAYPKSLLASVVRANMEMPEIPMEYYADNRKLQQFVMQHFLDNFPWEDPRIFNTPDAEKKFESYTHYIYNIDNPSLDTFVIDALKASNVNPLSHKLFFERLDRDLGFYMSDYKVEHTYIKMLQYVLNTHDLEDYRRVFYEKELSLINKNLEGTRAANFQMVTHAGDTTTLYELSSEYLLLFLHNPTCHTCQAVKKRMATFPSLNKAIESGRFKVLTIYMEDDPAIWSSYLKTEAQPNYIHGWNFDQAIEKEALYETRTIPYMFLLDKDKRVIKKNLLVNEIEDYVEFLMQTR